MRSRYILLALPLLPACPAEEEPEPADTLDLTDTFGDSETESETSETSSDPTATSTSGPTGGSSGDVDVLIDIDLSGQPIPCIDVGTQALADFIPPGAIVECTLLGADGDGRIPAGLTVESDCTVSGTITEDHGGAWAWIVQVSAAGKDHLVPFCASSPIPDDMYTVARDPGAPLVPVVETFAPGASVAAPSDMPTYSITDPASCSEGACFFGYAFGVSASPFDPSTLELEPTDLVNDDNDAPIGFFHSMAIQGPAVPAEFETRPWIQSLELDYCIAADDQSCSGADEIRNNGNGGLNVAILMVPGA